jgi:imidazolonepropionase-like amidohydrolase
MLAALAFAAALCAPQTPVDTPIVAFVNVNVVPMDRDGVLASQTVIVRGGRIAALGRAEQMRVPTGATIVDGRGKYLMPGLAEMHGHLPNPNAGPELTETVLFLYVANGVTTVRGMLGYPANLELRDRITRGEVLGPRLWVAGPALGGNAVTSPEVGRRMVDEQKAAGYDHLKIQEGLSREAYDTIVATAKRLGMRFAGHVPNAVGVYHVLASGQASIDHLDNYVETVGGPDSADDRRIGQAVAATRSAGTWTVPTLALWEVFLGTDDPATLSTREELRYVPPQWRANWAQLVAQMRQNNPDVDDRVATLALRRRLLKALQDAGCPIVLGTDSPQIFSVPGFSIHRELASMAAAGLTPHQILTAGTRNVARYFGAEREFGTVAAGQRADLLLLDANPLADVGNVARRAGVMVHGRWLPESEIQARLERLAETYR